jgi:phage-related protein
MEVLSRIVTTRVTPLWAMVLFIIGLVVVVLGSLLTTWLGSAVSLFGGVLLGFGTIKGIAKV